MPRVLIVDDSTTERVKVAGIAGKWPDCEVLEADNGRTALDRIESHLPDIVLTDLQMPEMSGLDLVTAVKDEFPHIPIILMTAQGSEDIAAEALRRGAASYVPKMRLADDLIATLNQVYSTSQVAHTRFRLMHHIAATSVEFVLPNDLSLIRICVDQLLNTLRCLPLGDQTERLRVGIALQEALFNACFHGNLEVRAVTGDDTSRYAATAAERCRMDPWCHRRIRLRADINRERAIFLIADDGDGFDTTIADRSAAAEASENMCGRGLTLMQSAMDEVTYNSTGNQVKLVRYAVNLFDDDLDDDDDEDDEDDEDDIEPDEQT